MRILDRDGIGCLLEAAEDSHRPLLVTAVFTGLRLGELLGLTWADIDFAGQVVNVRRQLDRSGSRVEPKTPQAVRDVILMPALAKLLREHRLRSRFAADTDLVFSSATGKGLDHTVPRRWLKRALKRAGLENPDGPKLRFHDLRHTFASLLVAQGSNVVFVSRQIGHASPDITLRVYSHLFDRAEHAQQATAALEASFGNALETAGRNLSQDEHVAESAKVAILR